MVFYIVPRVGGTQDLSKYFKWQCQQIAKYITQLRLLKNVESFDLKMEQLSIDFTLVHNESKSTNEFIRFCSELGEF